MTATVLADLIGHLADPFACWVVAGGWLPVVRADAPRRSTLPLFGAAFLLVSPIWGRCATVIASSDRRALLWHNRHARRFRHDLDVFVIKHHVVQARPRHRWRHKQAQPPALPRRKLATTAVAQPQTAWAVIPSSDR